MLQPAKAKAFPVSNSAGPTAANERKLRLSHCIAGTQQAEKKPRLTNYQILPLFLAALPSHYIRRKKQDFEGVLCGNPTL
jgi:hypothetical protein